MDIDAILNEYIDFLKTNSQRKAILKYHPDKHAENIVKNPRLQTVYTQLFSFIDRWYNEDGHENEVKFRKELREAFITSLERNNAIRAANAERRARTEAARASAAAEAAEREAAAAAEREAARREAAEAARREAARKAAEAAERETAAAAAREAAYPKPDPKYTTEYVRGRGTRKNKTSAEAGAGAGAGAGAWGKYNTSYSGVNPRYAKENPRNLGAGAGAGAAAGAGAGAGAGANNAMEAEDTAPVPLHDIWVIEIEGEGYLVFDHTDLNIINENTSKIEFYGNKFTFVNTGNGDYTITIKTPKSTSVLYGNLEVIPGTDLQKLNFDADNVYKTDGVIEKLNENLSIDPDFTVSYIYFKAPGGGRRKKDRKTRKRRIAK